MSDIGEIFSFLKEENKKKKVLNHKNSIKILEGKGIYFTKLSEYHYRVGEYDFWPSTGKFLNRKTGTTGRGVFNLLKKLGKT